MHVIWQVTDEQVSHCLQNDSNIAGWPSEPRERDDSAKLGHRARQCQEHTLMLVIDECHGRDAGRQLAVRRDRDRC